MTADVEEYRDARERAIALLERGEQVPAERERAAMELGASVELLDDLALREQALQALHRRRR